MLQRRRLFSPKHVQGGSKGISKSVSRELRSEAFPVEGALRREPERWLAASEADLHRTRDKGRWQPGQPPQVASGWPSQSRTVGFCLLLWGVHLQT